MLFRVINLKRKQTANKKFPSIKHEPADLNITLEKEPEAGTPLGSAALRIE